MDVHTNTHTHTIYEHPAALLKGLLSLIYEYISYTKSRFPSSPYLIPL